MKGMGRAWPPSILPVQKVSLAGIFKVSISNLIKSVSVNFSGHLRVVQMLLKKGAILHRDHDGRTPLHLAAQNGHRDTMKLILNVHSHLLDQTDKDGVTERRIFKRKVRWPLTFIFRTLHFTWRVKKINPQPLTSSWRPTATWLTTTRDSVRLTLHFRINLLGWLSSWSLIRRGKIQKVNKGNFPLILRVPFQLIP